MKRPLTIVLLTSLLALTSACASTNQDGSKDSGLYGSIGVGRTY